MGELPDGRDDALYCRGIVGDEVTPYYKPFLPPQIQKKARYIGVMELICLHLETGQQVK